MPVNYYSSDFSSCYDAASNKYYYSTGQFVYGINVNTGITEDTIDLTNVSPLYYYLNNIAFNPLDGYIYGIRRKFASTSISLFFRLNPVTKVLTDLTSATNPFLLSGSSCSSVIDAERQQYFLLSDKLTAIDMYTGDILYQYPMNLSGNEFFSHAAFSCKYGIICGLKNIPSVPEEYFSSIDTTATITAVSSTPLPVYYYKQFLSGGTIDNDADIYFLSALDGRVYGVDINTGNLVYDYDYGSGFEFLFLESASNYYCPVLSVEEFESHDDILIFPSPASDEIRISRSHSQNSTLEIFDLEGRVIWNGKFFSDEISVNISNFSSGIYLLTIDNHQFKKFIVSH